MYELNFLRAGSGLKLKFKRLWMLKNGATNAHKGRRGGSKCKPGGYVHEVHLKSN
jgi:hypothetical protein